MKTYIFFVNGNGHQFKIHPEEGKHRLLIDENDKNFPMALQLADKWENEEHFDLALLHKNSNNYGIKLHISDVRKGRKNGDRAVSFEIEKYTFTHIKLWKREYNQNLEGLFIPVTEELLNENSSKKLNLSEKYRLNEYAKSVSEEFSSKLLEIANTQEQPTVSFLIAKIKEQIVEHKIQGGLLAEIIKDLFDNPVTAFRTLCEVLDTVLQISNQSNSIQDKKRRDALKFLEVREKVDAIYRAAQMESDEDQYDLLENKINTIPDEKIKTHLQQELVRMRSKHQSGEGEKVEEYINQALKIPFGKYSETNQDLDNLKSYLDKTHYGMEKMKQDILAFQASERRYYEQEGKRSGKILCLVGVPGVGKTSSAQAIAQATGRKSARIALGGVSDESIIRGHRKTYVGSACGSVVKKLQQCETMNPIIILDEIDKIGTSHHDNVESALLELLDSEQNHEFTDNFFDFPIDLSAVTFIATANSLNISEPLLDRLEIIEIDSYLHDEKKEIAKGYLIPKQAKENGCSEDEVVFEDEAIEAILKGYVREGGVRNLNRCIGKIFRQLVLEHGYKKNEKQKIQITVTPDTVKSILGVEYFTVEDFSNKEPCEGVFHALSYSEAGGAAHEVECVTLPNFSDREQQDVLQYTGNFAKVIEESVQVAKTAVLQRIARENLTIANHNIHLHFLDASTPKDGPSAGLVFATVIYSALTGKKLKQNIAMTGEISLNGKARPIGGVREKIIGGLQSGIKTFILPRENLPQFEELPESVKKQCHEVIFVDNFDNVLKHVLA